MAEEQNRQQTGVYLYLVMSRADDGGLNCV